MTFTTTTALNRPDNKQLNTNKCMYNYAGNQISFKTMYTL